MSVIAITLVFLIFYAHIHETGHWIAAKTTAFFIRVKLPMGDPKINVKEGYTSSSIYDELTASKRYMLIRLNALAGTAFPCLVYACATIPLMCTIDNPIILKTAVFLMVASEIVMTLSFFVGHGKHNDYQIFKHPEILSESGDGL